MTLLWLNFGLMINRIVQRVIFVTGYYGLTQGLLSVLRLFWGNLINFMANWRALNRYFNTAIHVVSRGIKQRMTSPA